MPVNSKVHRMFEHLKSAGYDEAAAARIAQSKTGLSLKTGRKPKGRK
jgi:hypothetical protein